MIQEDKELLLKDLCARLPYDIKCVNVKWPNDGYVEVHNILAKAQKVQIFEDWVDIEDCKPYLRPMSSMTEEELAEWQFELDMDIDGYCIPSYPALDWLNAHHFDYRGLIEMGLAIEAPEDMYKTE